MKLSYVLQMLASGELGNLNLATEDRMDIKTDKIPIVLRAINSGLADLHTRFLLRKDIAEIEIMAGEDTYTIESDNFVELLKVDYNNREWKHGSEFTLLDTNRLRFKNKLGILDTLRVEYKANHKVLTEVDVHIDSEIVLPMSYLNALLYFVASKLFTSIPNQLDGDLNEGVAYMRKFLDEVALLDRQGIDVDDLEPMDNFRSRGFV